MLAAGSPRHGHGVPRRLDREGPRGPWRWTDDRLRAELEAFLAERQARGLRGWPVAAEFDTSGREGLRDAIKRLGGATFWAAELGVPLRPGQDRSPYGESEALRDTRLVVAEQGRLPGGPALRRLGHPRLASYLSRRGGSKSFAARHRLLP